jgi:hypothetical protein
VRTLLAVLALTFVLTGCGDDDDPITSGGAGEKADPTATSEGVPPDEVEVCELATDADVEAAYGEDVPPGTFGSGGHNVNDIQWASDNCRFEIEDGLVVSVELSIAEDFPDGALLCPELESFDVPATPVEGLDASSAAWVNDKIDPDEGTLRICGETFLLNIDIESPDGSRDPDTMRDQTVALAEVVLGNLG